MISKDRQLIQQPVITSMPTTIQVTISLPTHIPIGSNHQPLDGRQLGGNPPGEHLLIHMLDFLDGQHLIHICLYHHLLCNLFQNQPPSYHIGSYHTQLMSKTTDQDAHIRVFKKAIKTNGEIVEANIINLFSFTFKNNIFEWGENYIQDHTNCTFEELEQTFFKRFRTVKNDEEVYM